MVQAEWDIFLNTFRNFSIYCLGCVSSFRYAKILLTHSVTNRQKSWACILASNYTSMKSKRAANRKNSFQVQYEFTYNMGFCAPSPHQYKANYSVFQRDIVSFCYTLVIQLRYKCEKLVFILHLRWLNIEKEVRGWNFYSLLVFFDMKRNSMSRLLFWTGWWNDFHFYFYFCKFLFYS